MGFLFALIGCALIKTNEFVEQNSPSKKQQIAEFKAFLADINRRSDEIHKQRKELGVAE